MQLSTAQQTALNTAINRNETFEVKRMIDKIDKETLNLLKTIIKTNNLTNIIVKYSYYQKRYCLSYTIESFNGVDEQNYKLYAYKYYESYPECYGEKCYYPMREVKDKTMYQKLTTIKKHLDMTYKRYLPK